MSILSRYNKLIANKELSFDEAQYNAAEILEVLSFTLSDKEKQRQFKSLPFRRDNVLHKGIYFYGRVGRGKTMLMDLFFQQLAIEKKVRIHFHRFMADVHSQLNNLVGVENPLECIAKQWAKKTTLLCFDEFFVSDIGDAMLLAGLFRALFEHGIVLVTTSNSHPNDLYRNGLQREKFLPTISLIKKYCQVVSIDGEQDHRMPDELNTAWMKNYTVASEGGVNSADYGQSIFKRITHTDAYSSTIIINHREVHYCGLSNDVIWFDFSQLCSSPRSQNDYIVIADLYRCVIVTDVLQFTGEVLNNATKGIEEGYIAQQGGHQKIARLDDEARRFIALVDELYDRKVPLIIHANVALSALYLGELLSFEFDRCQSRIIEMQSW